MSVPQNLTEAVEGIIKNKGELFSSFDVNAFEVPGGRDELWRFTPLKRLRGLHDGSAPATGHAHIAVAEGPGVTVETVRRDDARLGKAGVADWAGDMVHVSAHHAQLGKDAVLGHVNVTLGGEVVRTTATVRFTGPGGDAKLLGTYFADDGQHFESRLLVDHAQPNCKSDVLYKGALQGDPDSDKPDAHTVWIGDVLIRAEATGTDTYEANRNLVLTDGARADSVPNLEIETGEIVGAGHASATGRFDDEQLFYLRTRGIPEDQARRLVVRGFFGEIIAKIAVPAVRERLTEAIERELAITESKAANE